MARPQLALDTKTFPVPVLGPGTTVTLTAGAGSSNAAIPAETYVIRVASVQDCYIAFGTGGITASGSSMFFPKGSELFKVPAGATHIAVIQHTTGGAVSVTAME